MPHSAKKRTLVKRDTQPDSTEIKKPVVLLRKMNKDNPTLQRAPVLTDKKPAQAYCDEQGRGSCPRCGEKVHFTELREHLGRKHGFTKAELKLLDGEFNRKSIWVQVWQGGLPGLGKTC